MLDITNPHERIRQEAILAARRVLARRPVYLDTETTGLGEEAEVVEIAVINASGEVLLDTLVKPGLLIPLEATDLHGITNDMVASAPRFDALWQSQLGGLLTRSTLFYDQPIVIWNAKFDLRLIHQSLNQYGLKAYNMKQPFDAMLLYAEYYSEWNEWRGSYRWQTLERAAGQCQIDLPPNLHRALGDADLTRRVLEHVAAQEIES